MMTMAALPQTAPAITLEDEDSVSEFEPDDESTCIFKPRFLYC